MRYLLILLALTTFLCTCDLAPHPEGQAEDQPGAGSILISNQLPRLTTEGDTVDAHDGRIIKFGDQFYWYGTAYGETNGFTTANEYHVYRSPDMVSWEHVGPALADRPEGVYYRPHVIQQPGNGQYVLWYNWYPTLWDGHFGVAVSDTPEGPFTIVSDDVKVSNSELGVGDFGLFVDDNGAAYISYNTIDGHRVSVEKLSPDYLGSTMENGGYIAQYCEAGSMFKRNDIYYLLTDYTCCFCNQGAGARVYMADDPLGEWTLTNNINRRPGLPAHGLTDGEYFTTDYTPLNKRDSTFDALIIDLADDAKEVVVYHFTGDRQGQCGQQDNPQVHQLIAVPEFEVEYYDHGWQPAAVRFGAPEKTNMLQKLTLNLGELNTKQLRLRPRGDFPYQLRLTEVAGDVEKVYVNGGGPGPVIIPAQQTYVMEYPTEDGMQYLWMGDIWGSASDNVKGHDYQYWSSPLEFDEQGWIAPLGYEGEWIL